MAILADAAARRDWWSGVGRTADLPLAGFAGPDRSSAGRLTRPDERIAESYEAKWPHLFEPAAIDPVVSFLADRAGSGPVLELGIGTGRIALPLSRRDVRVHGIELSSAMVGRLRAQPGADAIGITIGDFATTRAGGTFRLAYLVRNTITNLTSQDEQAECFRTVAAQLEPGGCFVIENYIPQLQRLPPGETTRVFTATPDAPGVRAATTWPRRSRCRTTGGSSTASWRPSPHRTATYGHRSWT